MLSRNSQNRSRRRKRAPKVVRPMLSAELSAELARLSNDVWQFECAIRDEFDASWYAYKHAYAKLSAFRRQYGY